MKALQLSPSLLPARTARALRALEDAARGDGDPATALCNTVAAVWRIVTQVISEPALEPSRRTARALLARRELVQRGTAILAEIIRRGVEAGAFQPACVPWAVERLPFAIVAGACVHWVFGLANRPSLRVDTAVSAALELLRPEQPAASRRWYDGAGRRGAVNVLLRGHS